MRNRKFRIFIGLLLVVGAISIIFLTNMKQRPKIIILDDRIREDHQELRYVVYIDVALNNRGGSGNVTVWAELNQGPIGTTTWKKGINTYIEKGTTLNLTFIFEDPILSPDINKICNVWIQY